MERRIIESERLLLDVPRQERADVRLSEFLREVALVVEEFEARDDGAIIGLAINVKPPDATIDFKKTPDWEDSRPQVNETNIESE